MSYGRYFHNVDAAIVKDLPPYDFKLKQGLCKKAAREEDVIMRSLRYSGALSCNILKVRRRILNDILCRKPVKINQEWCYMV